MRFSFMHPGHSNVFPCPEGDASTRPCIGHLNT